MKAIGRLLRPLLYLTISNKSKRKYDFWIPLFFALTSVAAYAIAPSRPVLFNNGFIDKLNSLLQILAGFYIASLAAVASFPKREMDARMVGSKPVTLNSTENGIKKDRPISRRRFLCLMFGYLAFSSLVLYLFGSIASTFAPSIVLVIPPPYKIYAQSAFLFIYCLWYFNVFTTTLLGLFYLSDRMHWNEPVKQKESNH